MSGAVGGRRFLVSGRVQGVFFRASTAREAVALGITGWAENLPDGRVEVCAWGTAEALAQLDKWLWRGPGTARVDDVVTAPIPDSAPPDTFVTR